MGERRSFYGGCQTKINPAFFDKQTIKEAKQYACAMFDARIKTLND